MYLSLMNLADKYCAEIVCGGTLIVNQDDDIIERWPKLDDIRVYHQDEFINEYFPYKRIEIQPSVTNKIIKKKYFFYSTSHSTAKVLSSTSGILLNSGQSAL